MKKPKTTPMQLIPFSQILSKKPEKFWHYLIEIIYFDENEKWKPLWDFNFWKNMH